MSAVLATVVFELLNSSPINLIIVAVYRLEADADLFISNAFGQSFVKKTMMLTDEDIMKIQASSFEGNLPMNFCLV